MGERASESLSVVIPTLGRPELRHALEALAAQMGVGGFSVIVVHGPELTPDAIGALVRSSSTMKLETVAMSERSVGARRNAGAAASSSDLIAFTDDDCRVPTRWIAQVAGFFRAHPDIAVAGGAVVEPIRRTPIYSFTRRMNYMASSATMKIRPGGIPSLGAANLVIRRQAFETLGGFAPELASTEDYELLVRAHQAGFLIGTYLDDPPVEHWHATDLRAFLRRYRGYGRGVAQTVVRHGLDPIGHRLDPDASGPIGRLRSILRFAREDLHRHRPLADDRLLAYCGVHAVLAVLRAYAFHDGAADILLRGSARVV